MVMELQTITANVTGRIRRDTLNGREHLVAPLSLIVPGVLNGSRGPLYYPLEEVSKDPSVWNYMPLVLYHPQVNGQHVSARTPDILNRQGLGVILNTTVNGKLQAEGWFDVENTRRVAPEVIARLEQGLPIELSTGLFTDNEPAPDGAVFNGPNGAIAYTHIARNYRPDHVAILPDQRGACSVDDGCGVLVNQQNKRTLWQKLGELLGVEVSNANTKEEIDMDRKQVIDGLIANCACWEESDRETLNKFSDDKLTKLKEHSDKEQQAQAVANAAKQGAQGLNAPEHAPTANAATKNASDMTDEELEEEMKKRREKKKKPTGNEQQTDEEWLASAPPGIRSAVLNAREVEQRERKELLNRLTANVKGQNGLTDEAAKLNVFNRLKEEPLDKLRMLADLLPKPIENKPQPLYFGAAAPVDNQISSQEDKDDILIPPTINWEEEAKASAE